MWLKLSSQHAQSLVSSIQQEGIVEMAKIFSDFSSVIASQFSNLASEEHGNNSIDCEQERLYLAQIVPAYSAGRNESV
jgi:hypothetical protein